MMRLVLLSVVVACDRSPPAAELLARAVNPSLVAMRTAAETVLTEYTLTEGGSDVFLEACLGHDAELRSLMYADFGFLGPELKVEIPKDVDYLLRGSERVVFCQPEHLRRARCERWCAISWTQLVIDVERARSATGGDMSPIASLLRTNDEKSRAFDLEQATKREDAR